ncbi:MAG: D-alanyl-D-alanine endopeptidase [Gammaproteobacteria bacterium]|nr:D-alanyl-D-alanine endopeptidase [Gammaproteobacteria bacterium]
MKKYSRVLKIAALTTLLSVVFNVNVFAQEAKTDRYVHTSSSADDEAIPASALKHFLNPKKLRLYSSTALVLDLHDGTVLYEREADKQMAIASVTKLMTAIVTLDKQLDMHERIRIKRADRDRLRGSKSRLAFGTILTRKDTIKIALAASENRAAKALARTYPGGKKAFIAAMNKKAHLLGMNDTAFRDSTGLTSKNVSTAKDLVKLLVAANRYPMIREFTTLGKSYVTDLRSGWKVEFFNTNRLVRRKNWDINVSKTGYIADAGHCLVMHTEINNRPTAIVLLNSWGKLSKFGDSNRIKRWLQSAEKRAEKTLATL